MSNLISGKEALIALANDEDVEFKDGMEKWENIKHHMNLDLSMFLTAPEWMKFRLKPRTITINNIEVPAPFEPKEGDKFYNLQPCNKSGWSGGVWSGDVFDKTYSQFGVWRTESEIKQVVAALRNVFGGSK